MSRPPPYWTGPPPPLGGQPPQRPPGMFMMHGPPLPPNMNQQRPRDLVNIQTMPNQRSGKLKHLILEGGEILYSTCLGGRVCS